MMNNYSSTKEKNMAEHNPSQHYDAIYWNKCETHPTFVL